MPYHGLRRAAVALALSLLALTSSCGGGSDEQQAEPSPDQQQAERTPEDRAIAACQKLVEARDADGPTEAAPIMNEAVRLADSATARDQQWNDVLKLMQGEKLILDTGPYTSFSRRTTLGRCSGLLADSPGAAPDEPTPHSSNAKSAPCPSGDIRAQIEEPVITDDVGDYRSEVTVVVENRTSEPLDVEGVDVKLDAGDGGVVGLPATIDSGKSRSWTAVIYTSSRPTVVSEIGWDFDWTDDAAFDRCPIPDPIATFS